MEFFFQKKRDTEDDAVHKFSNNVVFQNYISNFFLLSLLVTCTFVVTLVFAFATCDLKFGLTSTLAFQFSETVLFVHNLSKCSRLVVICGTKIPLSNHVVEFFQPLLTEFNSFTMSSDNFRQMTSKNMHVGSNIFR